MKPGHLLLLLVFNVFWAAGLSAYKALSAHLDPGAIVTLRFGLAGLGLLALWPLLPGRTPRGRDLLVTVLMGGVVFVLGHRLQVLGIRLGTAGNSSVLVALEPLVTSLAAAMFLGESIQKRQGWGFGLAMLGVALLNGVWRADFQWVGFGASLLFIASFLCEAAYSVLGKPLLARAGAAKVLTLALLSGLALNLLLDGSAAWSAAGRLPEHGWWLMLYLAVVCTMLGYSLWYVVIRETEVTLAALTIFVQPVAGVAIAVLWLREPLHWGQLWGSLAIGAGLIVGLWPASAPTPAPDATRLTLAED